MANNTTGFSFALLPSTSSQELNTRARSKERDTAEYSDKAQSFQRAYDSVGQADNKPRLTETREVERSRSTETKRAAEPKPQPQSKQDTRAADTRTDKKSDDVKSSDSKADQAVDHSNVAKDSSDDDASVQSKDTSSCDATNAEDTDAKLVKSEENSKESQDPLLSDSLINSTVAQDLNQAIKVQVKNNGTELEATNEETAEKAKTENLTLSTDLKQSALMKTAGKHLADVKTSKLGNKDKSDADSLNADGTTDLLQLKTSVEPSTSEQQSLTPETATANLSQPGALGVAGNAAFTQSTMGDELKNATSGESSAASALNSNLLSDAKLNAAQNSQTNSSYATAKTNSFENALLSENKTSTLDAKLSSLETSLSKDMQTPASSAQTDFSKINQQLFESPQLLQNDPSQAAARAFSVKTSVDLPVGQPQWSQAVSDKVLWLAAQNVSSAELQLHPQDLGPLHVKISIGQDQVTTVNFTSHHAQVREILDQNIHRLKDMLAEQGMNSVNVDVSDKSFKGDSQKFASSRSGSQNKQSVAEEEPQLVAVTHVQNLRLVDHYA